MNKEDWTKVGLVLAVLILGLAGLPYALSESTKHEAPIRAEAKRIMKDCKNVGSVFRGKGAHSRFVKEGTVYQCPDGSINVIR